MFLSFILYFISLNINCPDKENYDKCLQFKIFYSKTILIISGLLSLSLYSITDKCSGKGKF